VTEVEAARPDERPLLVLVESGGQAAREYFFQAVAPHYRLWLLFGGAGRPATATWQVPYLAGSTSVDTMDVAALARVVRELHQREAVAGILCFDEARIEATAKVASELGLRTSPPGAVRRCRDKLGTREALAAANVPQAASVAVRSYDEAAEVAEQSGYPVVLKPRHLAASFGIQLAGSPGDLAAAYRMARDTTLPEAPEVFEAGVLVEEYLDGPEISVDAACFDGRVVPLVIARKETGYPPYFEETGHLVDAADPLRTDVQLLDVLTRAHAAIGYTTGVTHTEFRLTAGGPKVIEINGRIGGDFIPYLGQLATGVDVSLASAAIACGRPVEVRHDRSRVAAVRFYYPDRPMTVADVRFDRALLPAEIHSAAPMVSAGASLRLPPAGFSFASRLAFATAVADTAAACWSALDGAAKALAVTTVPDNTPAEAVE